MPRNIIKSIIGGDDDVNGSNKKIEGTVVLMKKNVLDFNDFNASVIDSVKELLGQRVSLQLISAVNGDPGNYFLIFSNFNNTSTIFGIFILFMIFFSCLFGMEFVSQDMSSVQDWVVILVFLVVLVFAFAFWFFRGYSFFFFFPYGK